MELNSIAFPLWQKQETTSFHKYVHFGEFNMKTKLEMNSVSLSVAFFNLTNIFHWAKWSCRNDWSYDHSVWFYCAHNFHRNEYICIAHSTYSADEFRPRSFKISFRVFACWNSSTTSVFGAKLIWRKEWHTSSLAGPSGLRCWIPVCDSHRTLSCNL